MLNPLIDSENITNSDQQKSEGKQKQSGDNTSDCSWCMFCDLNCLFMCCVG